MAAIYPTIRSSIEQLATSYPSGLKEAFGVQAMNTVEGYIHAELFSLIVPLAIAYYAIRAVATPIVGAEERGQLDTILALPLSRTVLAAGACLVAAHQFRGDPDPARSVHVHRRVGLRYSHLTRLGHGRGHRRHSRSRCLRPGWRGSLQGHCGAH